MSQSEQEDSPLKKPEKSVTEPAGEIFMALLLPGVFGVGYSLLALVILSVRESRPFWQPPSLSPNQHIVLVTILLGAWAVLSFGGILLCLLVRGLHHAPRWKIFSWLAGSLPFRWKREGRQAGEVSRERTPRDTLKTWPERKALVRIFWSLFVVSMLFGVASFSTAFTVTAEADMTRTSFVEQELTINVGDNVIFANPADGVAHQLCLASHEECLRTPPAGVYPLLSHEFRLLPGQNVSMVFNAAGDYQIIDAFLPQIAIIIHVNSSS